MQGLFSVERDEGGDRSRREASDMVEVVEACFKILVGGLKQCLSTHSFPASYLNPS